MIQQAYIYNLTTDKNAINTAVYAAQFPQMVKRECVELQRVKLQAEQFELNDQLDIDKDFKVKESLVWKTYTRVMDPDNPETDILAYSIGREGMYDRPFGSITRDKLGNVVSSKVAFWRHMFWVEFTEENVKAVLDQFDNKYTKVPKLCVAQLHGESPYSAVYSCPNFSEWLKGEFDSLVSANKTGTLQSEYGGYALYLRQKDEKQRDLNERIKAYDPLATKERKSK